MLHAALFAALALLLARRRSLPLGALTGLAAVSGAVLGYVVEQPILIGVVAASGLVCDLLIWRLRPVDGRAWRWFSAGLLIPLVVFGPPLVVAAARQAADYSPQLVGAMVAAATVVGLIVALPFALIRLRRAGDVG